MPETSNLLTSLWNKLIEFGTTFGAKLLGTLAVLIVGRILVKWVIKLVRKSKPMQKADPTVARFFVNVLSVVLNIILVISIIGILGVPMASVITVLATAGVAIGAALQGSLSNLAGGIMILIFHPFRLDEFIEVGSYSGTVKDIGIFYTVLHTGDNRSVTIPNGTIMSSEIVNYSVNATRRVDLTFSAAYGTDVALVRQVLLEEAEKHELALKDPAPFCRLSQQNDSSLDFVLRVWTKKEDYWTVNFDLLEAINNRFAAEGIEVPYNTIDVNITSQK